MTKKEREMIAKYQDLRQELARLWNTKSDSCSPCGNRCTGDCIWKFGQSSEENSGVIPKIELLQKAVLLGTARLLRKVAQEA